MNVVIKLFIAWVLSISIIPLSLADDIPLVDGKIWANSTTDNKHSYLIGISNLLSIEYAYQKASKKPLSNEQSIIPRFYEDIDELSLDETTQRIDQWYKKHPQKLNKAVIDVIWVDMVELK